MADGNPPNTMSRSSVLGDPADPETARLYQDKVVARNVTIRLFLNLCPDEKVEKAKENEHPTNEMKALSRMSRIFRRYPNDTIAVSARPTSGGGVDVSLSQNLGPEPTSKATSGTAKTAEAAYHQPVNAVGSAAATVPCSLEDSTTQSSQTELPDGCPTRMWTANNDGGDRSGP